MKVYLHCIFLSVFDLSLPACVFFILSLPRNKGLAVCSLSSSIHFSCFCFCVARGRLWIRRQKEEWKEGFVVTQSLRGFSFFLHIYIPPSPSFSFAKYGIGSWFFIPFFFLLFKVYLHACVFLPISFPFERSIDIDIFHPPFSLLKLKLVDRGGSLMSFA